MGEAVPLYCDRFLSGIASDSSAGSVQKFDTNVALGGIGVEGNAAVRRQVDRLESDLSDMMKRFR